VSYHVPIYSACGLLEENLARQINAILHWVPLFDNYRVITAYENHVHAFKRTKPIRGNYVTENGTVYLGEGCFGAIPNPICKPDATSEYFAVIGEFNNFWVS